MVDRKIGAQFYTLREFCKTKEDFEKSCEKVSKIGYKTVQLSSIGPIAANDVKEIIDKYSLKAVLTHRPSQEFEEKTDELIEYHKTIGCDIAGLGVIPDFHNITEQYLNEFIKKYNIIAEKLEKNGITFAYHNHAIEFAKIKGKYIFDILAEETHPNFKFTMDVYWTAFAGINPAKCLVNHKGKIACVHFKDLGVDFSGEGKPMNIVVMRPVMEGNLNWDEIIAAADESGAKWAQVEQDNCNGEDPFDCLERSYKNLKTKGFC